MGLYARALESLDAAVSLAVRDPSSQSVLTQLRTSILRDRSKANLRRLEGETDESRRQEILKAARLKAKKATINYIHRLPRDVLICIAEKGGLALKMGMVCREWREVVGSQPGLWSCLTLGKGKSVAKAKLWKERSNGRILELRIEQGFDVAGKGEELVSTLGCCLESVETLAIHHEETETMLDDLRGTFVNLKRLIVRQIPIYARCGTKQSYYRSLDLGIILQDSGPLRHIDIDDLWLDVSLSSALTHQAISGPNDQPENRFSAIDTLRLTGGDIKPWIKPVSLLKLFPSMRDFSLTDKYCNQESQEPTAFTHEVLRSYAGDDCIKYISFEHLNAPSLTSLSLSASGASFDPIRQILAPGLSVARPQLTFLDISRSAVDNRLLLALADLSSLRFLNVSFCTFDDDILIALQRKKGKEDLLPRLTALSMAGNFNITSGAVRDLVNSRLPAVLRLSGTKPVGLKKKTSSFQPTAPPQSDAVDLIPVELPPSESSRPDDLPMITWLNIDACERIDAAVANNLRQRVRFVSNVFGNMSEDRIRGKGAWAWDGDWSEHCGNGLENKCHLRPIEGRSRDLPQEFLDVSHGDQVPETNGMSSMSVATVTRWM